MSRSGVRTALRGILAAALILAGVGKLVNPEELGLFRLFGDPSHDPPWIIYLVSGIELATALALICGRLVGTIAAVAVSCAFVVYHVVLGLGFGAPT